MKISIIIPIYNVAQYIINCLESIYSQSYKNIECILIDDCGTDNSMELVLSFIQNHNNNIEYVILHHKNNKGLSAARNTGIHAAKGDYIYFLDSDDMITPDCLKILKELIDKYPNSDFAQGNFIDINRNISQYGFSFNILTYCNDKEMLDKLILTRISTTATNRLIKRTFLIENSLYFPEGLIHEDMYWTYFMSKKVKAASFTNKGTYIYRINPNSIMTSISKIMRINRYTSRIIAAHDFIYDMNSMGYTNSFQRQYLVGNLLSCMVELSKLKSLKHWWVFWKFIKDNTFHNIKKNNAIKSILLLIMFPPFCFMMAYKWWYWRIQHYIVSRL